MHLCLLSFMYILFHNLFKTILNHQHTPPSVSMRIVLVWLVKYSIGLVSWQSVVSMVPWPAGRVSTQSIPEPLSVDCTENDCPSNISMREPMSGMVNLWGNNYNGEWMSAGTNVWNSLTMSFKKCCKKLLTLGFGR